MDRKQIDAIIAQNRQLYQDQLKKMRESGATPEELGKLKKMLFDRENQLLSQGDGLQRLNQGQSINMNNATVSHPELDQSKMPDASKQALQGKQSMFKNIGKRVAGIIPLAGVGMAAMSGDPAMAAEELAQDAMGPAGLAYEAIKPTAAGNPEEEQMMLAERDAMDAYSNSPAAQDAKYAKIRASLIKK